MHPRLPDTEECDAMKIIVAWIAIQAAVDKYFLQQKDKGQKKDSPKGRWKAITLPTAIRERQKVCYFISSVSKVSFSM